MKKIRRFFRETLLDISNQPAAIRKHIQQSWEDPKFLATLDYHALHLNTCLKNWFAQKNMAERPLLSIKRDSQTFLNLVDNLMNNLIQQLLQQHDQQYQTQILMEYFKEDFFLINKKNTLCIEFEDEVYFPSFSDESSKFTELILSGNVLLMYNGFTEQIAYNENIALSTILYVFLSSSKLKEIYNINNDGIDKISINTTSKIEGKSLSKGKIHPLWNYRELTVTTEKIHIKTGIKRPIDFETREEVILERRPHYRKLRNGELRFFSGVKATYYKLKDIEKLGTIVKIS